MFKLPIPTRLTDYLGEAVVWTVIYNTKRKRDRGHRNPRDPGAGRKINLYTVMKQQFSASADASKQYKKRQYI